VALVIPELKGKFGGYSLRVPTPTVSVVDFACTLEKSTTTEELRAALKAAADGELKGILGYATEPLVSMDYKGDPRSGIVEEEYTVVQNGNMAKVVAWYDNEWGYSCRVADLVKLMADKGM
jgi:glyceraldehyde 3-phosphate dehydrogenase